jgi:hypothetical protein
MRRIDVEERRSRLGLRHGLAGSVSSPLEAAERMVGLHSSDPASVFLSCWARIDGFAPDDLEAALYESKDLLRILGMRRTMWVVPTSLAPAVNSSSTITHAATQRRRTQELIETSGIADDGEEWVRRVSAATIDALESLDEATASELTELVPELGEKVEYRKKDGTLMGTFGMSTRVLFLLATEGRVIRGRPRGSWISSQYRWCLMGNWSGHDLENLDGDVAREVILGHWLHSFGPARELDMKWWTGWTVGQVRKTLASLSAIEVELDEGTGYVMPDDLEPATSPSPWVALLPGLDPTTMGWKQREWYLGAHAEQLFDRNGNAGPTVWVDGQAVGGWTQRKDGEVAVELLQDVGNEARSAIEGRATNLQSWLGDIRIRPRFRTPLEKALTG